MNRYITATQIHNGYNFLKDPTVIEVQEDGSIIALHLASALDNTIKVEFYDGILCPGFVNVHCHLELSHLKNLIPENKGLVGFVSQVPKVRVSISQEEKEQAIIAAAQEMYDNGVVAVGDIANTTDSIKVRAHVPLHIHTFVECMGVVTSGAPARFDYAVKVFEAFQQATNNYDTLNSVSIVPHAPYSVAPVLYELINEHSKEKIVSVHNQESKAEIDFFQDGTGEMWQLYDTLGIPQELVQFPQGSALSYNLKGTNKAAKTILVHNTFMNANDMSTLSSLKRELYVCLCPNANWYIERQLPNIPAMLESNLTICLGTDSWASNYSLSIYDEIIRIQDIYPTIPLETLLQWATNNGAQALGMDGLIGSITVNKTPGINLISKNNTVNKII
jgi:cytosine/adenosine deaminase-related metal-dependent hydrolase